MFCPYTMFCYTLPLEVWITLYSQLVCVSMCLCVPMCLCVSMFSFTLPLEVLITSYSTPFLPFAERVAWNLEIISKTFQCSASLPLVTFGGVRVG